MTWHLHTCQTEWHGAHPLGGIQTPPPPPPVVRGPYRTGQVRILAPFGSSSQEAVLQALTTHGPRHPRELAEIMNCRPCHVKTRLTTLKAKSLVSEDNDGAFELYTGAPPEDAPVTRQILARLAVEPNSTGLQVALAIGVPREHVASALSKLVKSQRVVSVKTTSISRYSLAS